MKIGKADGSALSQTDVVAPSHDFFAAICSGVRRIQLNGYPVSSSGTAYGYRHHFFNLLTYGTGYKSSILTKELFYPDRAQNKFVAAENHGFKERQGIASLSKEFECIGSVNEAIFKQQRYVPGFVTLLLTLKRNDPTFYLDANSGTTQYKLIISEAVFCLKRHVLSPEVASYHQKFLAGSKKFQYPMRQSLVRAFTIAKGSQTHLFEVLFRHKLPELCILTFVKTNAYIGTYTENPFYFSDFKVSSIQLSVDGDKTVYSDLTANRTERLYLMGYNTLGSALTTCFSDHGINRTDYLNGCFCVCIPLMPNNHNNRFQLERSGSLSVELKFHAALSESITCIVLGVFATKMEIDGSRTVYYDQP
jgi:hypothetical protein